VLPIMKNKQPELKPVSSNTTFCITSLMPPVTADATAAGRTAFSRGASEKEIAKPPADIRVKPSTL
jgi:hypothetical protein